MDFEKFKSLVHEASSAKLNKNKAKKPWVTNEIVTLINKKEKAYKKLDENRQDPKLKKIYKDLEYLIKNKLLISKEAYKKSY